MAHVRHAYQTAQADNPDAEISSNKWNEDHDCDGLMPPGAMAPFAGSSAPTGWLLCDGSAVSRSTYAALFAVLGTTFGAGNGSTTFNVPNAKGRVLVGLDAGQTEFDALAETGGAKTHQLTAAEMPSHTHTQNSHNHTQDAHTHTQNAHSHTITDPGHSHGMDEGQTDGAGTLMDRSNAASATTTTTNSATTGITVDNATATNQNATATNQAATATNQNTGGDGAHNNLQPYLVIHWIIKT